ncbi:MAG: hypothetical protein KGP13_06930 [Burkholderiales bacterium]|nr:hypothetical protein [Burkholderiales bacterium]
MNIALFGAYRLLNPSQPCDRHLQSITNTSCPSITNPQLPLRIARVLEGQQNRQNAGRMLISGRMADVCAELDRLAESERRR